MSQLTITDLNFVEVVLPEKSDIKGGVLDSNIVPDVSTATSTAVDTRTLATQDISGNLESGFDFNILTLGSAAAAVGVGLSIGGRAIAFTRAKA